MEGLEPEKFNIAYSKSYKFTHDRAAAQKVVAQYEKHRGVKLPDEFREYYLNVSTELACSYYPVKPLLVLPRENGEDLCPFCGEDQRKTDVCKPLELDYFEPPHRPDALVIGNDGCGQNIWLRLEDGAVVEYTSATTFRVLNKSFLSFLRSKIPEKKVYGPWRLVRPGCMTMGGNSDDEEN